MTSERLHLITGLGLGFMRPFPGTWGSLPPVVLAAILLVAGAPAWAYNGSIALMFVVFSAACIFAGDRAEARFGRKDPSQVVADEVAGQCLPLLFLPAVAQGGIGPAGFTIFFAFFAFRVFDILKIWPARQIQVIPGGWGILLDDLVAGLQAWIVLRLVSLAAG